MTVRRNDFPIVPSGTYRYLHIEDEYDGPGVALRNTSTTSYAAGLTVHPSGPWVEAFLTPDDARELARVLILLADAHEEGR